MRKLTLILCVFSQMLFGQELNCTVTVNTSSLERGATADQQVFVDMRRSIEEFLNNRRWTNDAFAQEERIKANLVVNLLKADAQFNYVASIQFQVFRPVYGTNYQTLLLNHIDRSIGFSYKNEDRSMLFNENSFQNMLASTLAFYALLAVGLDYDAMSKLGGTPHLQRAVNVITLEMNALGMANKNLCNGNSIRSKYCLSENLISPQLLPFREALYSFHRLGLDAAHKDALLLPKQTMDLLNILKKMANDKQNVGIVDSFMDAKSDEFINIFTESTTAEKQKAFNLLAELDPGKTEKYRALISK